jgi:hypothetical protein
MIMTAKAAALLIGLAFASLVSSAVAEESAYRRSLTERALKEGFGRSEVQKLSVAAASDRSKTAERLREQASSGAFGKLITLTFDKPIQEDDKTLSFVADEGYLQIYADGSRFKLRGDIAKVNPVEADGGKERIEIGRLERLARDYVQGPLKEFVVMQDGESLTFLGSRYFRQGGGSVNERTGKEYLVANIAVLGREVDGVPVVGSGSKIAVWITPDGEVVGADVDWPQYKRGGDSEPLLPVDELRRRITAASIPVESSETVKIARFECGYVDLGATRRKADAPIQPGCAISYNGVETNEMSGVFARQDFVPAGRTVDVDERWPLATYIARNGEPKPGVAYTTPKVEPPPSDPSPQSPPPKE